MIINFIPTMATNTEDIQVQLWAYIDKACNDAEMQRIASLITTDKNWEAQYKELLAFHNELAHIEAEQPSLRFTKNVMEAITAAKVAPAAKTYVNPWVLRSIAAIFAVLLAGIFIYILSGLNWNTPSSTASSFPFGYNKTVIGNWWAAIILVNVVLLIIFIDALLGRKKAQS